jgi:arginyl-tRNA synthetase
LKQLELFPEVIQNAAQNHSPAFINFKIWFSTWIQLFYQADQF